MVKLCDNSRSKVVPGGCFGDLATTKVILYYDRDKTETGIFCLCEPCLNKFKKEAKRLGYLMEELSDGGCV
jgi:hydrogenase maturation factor HypF (carbamoyltransferase family)